MDQQQIIARMHAVMRRSLTLFGGRLALLFVGLGALVVGIATNGAASFPIVAAQMPYLLSGLGIGLGLILFGSALMVVQSAREDRARLEGKFDELLSALQSIAPGTGAPMDLQGLVMAGASSYHVPGCRLVQGHDEARYLTASEARGRQLEPCRVCHPSSPTTAGAAPAAVAAPVPTSDPRSSTQVR